MFIAVVEKNRRDEPKQYVLDSEKLHPSRYIDRMILNVIRSDKFELSLYINAKNWEDNPLLENVDNCYWYEAISDSIKADKSLLLTIDYDC